MRTLKIAIFTAIIAVTGVFGYSSYQKNQKPALSVLALANIEALTQSEGDNSSDLSGYQICSTTRTTSTKRTDESGFSWDVGLSVWLLNGKVSKKSPTHSYEVTETVNYNCCMNGGPESQCSYVKC